MKFGIRRRPFCVCAVLASVASMNVFGFVSTAAQSAPSTYSAYRRFRTFASRLPSGARPRELRHHRSRHSARAFFASPTATPWAASRSFRLIPDSHGHSTRIRPPSSSSTSRTGAIGSSSTAAASMSATDRQILGVHALTSFDARWEWSAVNPDVMYILRSSTIAKYNKATGALTDLGGPSNGDPVAYHAAVVGADAWVCSAAGSGGQNWYTEDFLRQSEQHANNEVHRRVEQNDQRRPAKRSELADVERHGDDWDSFALRQRRRHLARRDLSRPELGRQRRRGQ